MSLLKTIRLLPNWTKSIQIWKWLTCPYVVFLDCFIQKYDLILFAVKQYEISREIYFNDYSKNTFTFKVESTLENKTGHFKIDLNIDKKRNTLRDTLTSLFPSDPKLWRHCEASQSRIKTNFRGILDLLFQILKSKTLKSSLSLPYCPLQLPKVHFIKLFFSFSYYLILPFNINIS